jgi:hypothetical protein
MIITAARRLGGMLSKKTLSEFREHLVGWTLRTIDDVFMNHGFISEDLPLDRLPGGQRRNRVEEYYAAIDLRNPQHVKRLIKVFEDILLEIPQENAAYREKLVSYLKRDGFEYVDHRLVSRELDIAALQRIAGSAIDTEHLHVYLERIGDAVQDDPSLAIGSAKELVEATLKTILRARDVAFDESEEIPKLLRLTQKELALVPDDIPDATRGGESIKRLLSNLGSIVYAAAELRNLYGSGHGRSGALRGLLPRHARLVVSSAGALCTFLLETYEARKAKAVS